MRSSASQGAHQLCCFCSKVLSVTLRPWLTVEAFVKQLWVQVQVFSTLYRAHPSVDPCLNRSKAEPSKPAKKSVSSLDVKVLQRRPSRGFQGAATVSFVHTLGSFLQMFLYGSHRQSYRFCTVSDERPGTQKKVFLVAEGNSSPFRATGVWVMGPVRDDRRSATGCGDQPLRRCEASRRGEATLAAGLAPD